MMKFVFYISIVLSVLHLGVEAQSVFILDRDTEEPVPQVFVEIRGLNTNIVHYIVSARDGSIEFPVSDDFYILAASHMNYIYYADTISSADHVVYLSPTDHSLREVVVTGQYQPQSAAKSVYVVRSIDSEELGLFAARDINDVLLHQLNFRSFYDIRQGKQSFSLQGVSGNNLLVLLDGIPVNGRTSDDFDFSHIPINQIEKIEIVEGPMSVLYGSNAMAGVVNIITKNNYGRGLTLGATIHEETVGKNYGWNSGIHNFSISSSYGPESIPIQFSGGFSRNLFHGNRGELTKRAMLWKPKEAIQANIGVHYRPNLWNLRFRLDFLDEVIDAPGEPVGIVRPVALDDRWHTQRFLYQFHAGRSIENFGRLESTFALTDYTREKTQMAVNINNGTSQPSMAEGAFDFTSLISFQNRSVLNFLAGDRFRTQLGYGFEYEKIEGGRLIDEKSRSVYELAIFGSFEYELTPQLVIRPGIRYTHNQLHPSPIIPSLNIKYDAFSGLGIRFAYGRGYRAPSLREMYFEFFDSNHRVIGNENLMAEKGHHFSLNLNSFTNKVFSNTLNWSVDLFYNYIYDQITYGRSVQNPLNTTLINQSLFESVGVRLSLDYEYKGLTIRPSFSYTGRKNVLSDESDNPGFLYSPEAGMNIRYIPRSSPWNFALNYTFYGEQPVYAADIEDVTQELQLSSIDAYHWLDANVSRKFGNRFQATLGVRNILDVTDINSTPALGSIHPSGDREYVSYGRTLFLKLNFSLK